MGGENILTELKVESTNEKNVDAPGVEATRRRDEAGGVSKSWVKLRGNPPFFK